MTGFNAKADLLDYLQGARETLLWKLGGAGNMSSDDPAWWRDYHDQAERAAQASGRPGR